MGGGGAARGGRGRYLGGATGGGGCPCGPMFPRIDLHALDAKMIVGFRQSLAKPKNRFVPLFDCRERSDEFCQNLGPGPWVPERRNSAARYTRAAGLLQFGSKPEEQCKSPRDRPSEDMDQFKLQGRNSYALCNPLPFVEIPIVGSFDSGFGRIHIRAEEGRTRIKLMQYACRLVRCR